MLSITEMRQSAGERYELTFSDGTTLKSTLSVVADYALYTGRELSEEEYAAVADASTLSRCKDRAMRLMGLRPMSQRELYDRLVEKGESEGNAAETVAWLISLGLLDDAAYAAMVVRHNAAKGYGPRRIRDELYRHKVPRQLWDEALEELPEQDDKIDRLLRSKLRSEHPDRTEIKKATDALLRRGFSWEDIRAALARYHCEIEEFD